MKTKGKAALLEELLKITRTDSQESEVRLDCKKILAICGNYDLARALKPVTIFRNGERRRVAEWKETISAGDFTFLRPDRAEKLGWSSHYATDVRVGEPGLSHFAADYFSNGAGGRGAGQRNMRHGVEPDHWLTFSAAGGHRKLDKERKKLDQLVAIEALDEVSNVTACGQIALTCAASESAATKNKIKRGVKKITGQTPKEIFPYGKKIAAAAAFLQAPCCTGGQK